ncbi:aminomethyl-transferring glycine dehydrogenase subunit GcvPB [Acuticoccus sp. M5D2P5]|uniref:aminomethyl-transferring glycine dehydrogenase subunit GcvPB n=1 Tax=Acuticoccus kalidii TaxID=2910977 RepID=UPI001F32BCC1|nr:aminomethyl-transferring glycine dehydrogenase subunit GcvPB [Acuticoccus kalidii]MCF3932515.1 aminomethyl-transferring glycine dehydrogenase subunit GcvPB [Acuticoccus kalidii]
MTGLRRYHAAVWDEPVIMEMGAPGRRGILFPPFEPGLAGASEAGDLIPAGMAREDRPALPELSEPEVLRHFLHLSQETLGMAGISLFGTCTMKYNAPVSEQAAWRPQLAAIHPEQDEETLQGLLEILHEFDLILREVSGMDQFVFQAGGGAHAAYTHCAVTRAYFAAKGELERRDEIITTIQTHPCNAATAAAAGFKVITLMLEEDGYPSVEALKAAVSERTAALMINNPDDMGIYNPHIKQWVEIVHEAGGLCFYDHANFNGVMGKIRARELGFDACMYMLHKTFGAPKGGGGPAVGAYGCSDELAPFLPRPVVVKAGDRYRLDQDRPQSCGKIREYFGNVPQVVKAYAWARAMGAEGIDEASDISVLANNYMEKRLLAIRGITKSHPDNDVWRTEMTRYSFETLKEETGVGVLDVQNRMIDFGIDAFWLSHEPWIVPEPFTPEAGEMYGKEDLDTWIDVLAEISREAYTDPHTVKTAPHNQAIHQLKGDALEDPARWAMTWRAYRRKRAAAAPAAATISAG